MDERKKQNENISYIKKGQVANAAIGSIIALVVGVGIVTIVIIFIGTLSGTTYQVSNLTFANNTGGLAVGNAVNASILNAFTTLNTTASYVPLIVLAVIIFIVLTLVLGFTTFTGGLGGRGGGAL